MSRELDMLASWAIESYIHNRESEEALLHPLLTIVGGDLDALTTVGDVVIGDGEIARLAFLIGYLGYPCDAIYLTCTWQAMTVESKAAVDTSGKPTMILGPPPEGEMGSLRESVMCWAHSVPTRESVLMLRSRHLDDTGGVAWQYIRAEAAAELSLFGPLVEAAHAFDQYPIESGELMDRDEAKAILQEANGTTHDTLFYDPGTLLEAARRHRHPNGDDSQTEGM